MTFLEICNEVLKRLREDTVSSTTESTYSTMISDFVKQAYIEQANAYNWPEFDETQDIAISASDTSMVITSGDSGGGVHQVHSIYNTTDDCFLKENNYKNIRDRLSDDTETNLPSMYAYGGETADGTTTIHFYPTSDSSYTLRVNYNRKPDLKNTFSDSTFIKTPELPIILSAWAMAISERGEDGGALSNEIDLKAKAALADVITLYENNTNFENSAWYVY